MTMEMDEMGRALIAFGRALLDETTTLREASDLAHAAGLTLAFRFEQQPPTPVTDTAGEEPQT